MQKRFSLLTGIMGGLLFIGAGCSATQQTTVETPVPSPAPQAATETTPTTNPTPAPESPAVEAPKPAATVEIKSEANAEVKSPVQQPAPTPVQPEPKPAEKPAPATPSVKSFSIVAKNWVFEPATITVKKGDTVKLSIKSVDVDHGFALSAFNVNKPLKPGQTTTVEFVADKTGSFTFFCSVFCGSGHSGMRGTLVVEE